MDPEKKWPTIAVIISCILVVANLLLVNIVAVAVGSELREAGILGMRWRETSPIRVVMKSTADWGRIMFDDEIGNNTNGIRFKYILSYGWTKGNDSHYEINVGKGTWYDVLYNVTIRKTGDIVAFNKQRNDFNYTEMYADIVFEVDTGMISCYVWLMLAGQGTTIFQLISFEHQNTVWQETWSGTGHTSHVRRYLMVELFFRRWEVSPTTVVVLTLLAILMMILLSPVTKKITGNKAKRRIPAISYPANSEVASASDASRRGQGFELG
jgi:hypothetical protein